MQSVTRSSLCQWPCRCLALGFHLVFKNKKKIRLNLEIHWGGVLALYSCLLLQSFNETVEIECEVRATSDQGVPTEEEGVRIHRKDSWVSSSRMVANGTRNVPACNYNSALTAKTYIMFYNPRWLVLFGFVYVTK